MLSIIFHLALTVAILWYQRKTGFKSGLIRLTVLWYLVSVALALIETYTQTGFWLTGTFLQSLILAVFYLPAIFFTLRTAQKNRMFVWKSFAFFLLGALIATVLAAICFAYIPFIQHLSS